MKSRVRRILWEGDFAKRVRYRAQNKPDLQELCADDGLTLDETRLMASWVSKYKQHKEFRGSLLTKVLLLQIQRQQKPRKQINDPEIKEFMSCVAAQSPAIYAYLKAHMFKQGAACSKTIQKELRGSAVTTLAPSTCLARATSAVLVPAIEHQEAAQSAEHIVEQLAL